MNELRPLGSVLALLLCHCALPAGDSSGELRAQERALTFSVEGAQARLPPVGTSATDYAVADLPDPDLGFADPTFPSCWWGGCVADLPTCPSEVDGEPVECAGGRGVPCPDCTYVRASKTLSFSRSSVFTNVQRLAKVSNNGALVAQSPYAVWSYGAALATANTAALNVPAPWLSRLSGSPSQETEPETVEVPLSPVDESGDGADDDVVLGQSGSIAFDSCVYVWLTVPAQDGQQPYQYPVRCPIGAADDDQESVQCCFDWEDDCAACE
jgi:hypothetical protein